MNIAKIAEQIIATPAPVGFVERLMDGGVPLSEDELQEAWSSTLQKLGYGEVGDWMDVGPFMQAYARFGAKLEGAEKWLADEVMDMAREAEAGGYQQMSGLGMSFVSRKSACSSCPAERRLAKLILRTGGHFEELRSRRK